MRCAENFHDDRLRYREVPMLWVMTTVFLAIKAVVMAMKTVIVRKSRRINEKRPVFTFPDEPPGSFHH
ncbi:hypothetical protein [uncultured Parabacteroides sp.]|uniref:hypothetical protein n=1 Tax=uncultured Parabacteroides sp. TaxID=512312 RepID=UPI00261D36A0|nr:hypothetical protein [uncultured Parabacteroides sp.]